MPFIIDLKPDTDVKGNYLCKYKQLLKNKNGKDYLTLRLQDKTGTIDAKVWALHQNIQAFQVDDVIYVEGQVLLYQDNLQLNVQTIKVADASTYELADYVPATTKELATLEQSLFDWIEQVEDVALGELLQTLFCDETIYETFKCHGAAKSVHHAYLNGLLEHTVSVTKLGAYMAELYHPVNRDLVIAGCLLHDFGKIYELSGFPTNDYTDEGQLLGHLILGLEKVTATIGQIANFPKETALLLKHILLAHHGEYEYGSPKRPKCIEAMIVHLADNADSKVKMFEEILQGEKEETYVGYHKLLGRNIRQVK